MSKGNIFQENMLSKIKSKKINHNPFRKYKNEKILYIAQLFYKQVYLKFKYLKLNQSQVTLYLQ